ncbi:MAG: hypothetical protein EIB84_05300 [Spiroplasma poulsonii]|uniref:Uncharacterized protein n=1 Tax=Spiroplasma poulsonii TaxID=2138 RepID=A0A2P6FDJ5_9MOLU|nr:hypothetical protein [Spiroplasma poulsonii]KAF0850869.1 hypothetical protein MSROBK_013500 [Spiroplasma poulsonii]MBW1242211.1 hypothetical protein [Spiroplasma poulsonii]PQM31492.1 hypothetical protein SMSRO_SF013270 [Spiroplasma poulsonii]PWF96507.1 hypothetical protein SMSE_19540 [Spiroplasma poulsonii]PWF97083.1 hypothetical protein SMH99_18920 [Spiroplasma poulsonii]
MGKINNISAVCSGCKAGLEIYLTKLLETYDINSEEITFFSYQHRQHRKILELKPIDVFRCNNQLFGFSLAGRSNPKFINNKRISWKVFQLHQKTITRN